MRPTNRAKNVPRRLVHVSLLVTFLGLPSGLNAQSAGTVSGSVVDEHGVSVVGAHVVITALRAGGTVARIDTGRDGRFNQSNIAAGLYEIRSAQRELGSDAYRLRIREGHTVEVAFVLTPGREPTPLIDAAARDAFAIIFAAGVAANKSGQYFNAVTQFNHAAELNRGCFECHYNTGVAYSSLKQWADAEKAFMRALTIDKEYAAAYYGLSAVYTELGRPNDATTARAKAHRIALASLDAGHQRAADGVTRGIVFYSAGSLDDARRLFADAIAESQNYAPAHYWLGVTLADLQENQRAVRSLRHYLSFDASGEHAVRARALLANLEP